MQKKCGFCEEPFLDGETIGFTATGRFKQIESKIAYAISKDFVVDEMFHRECFAYIQGGGK